MLFRGQPALEVGERPILTTRPHMWVVLRALLPLLALLLSPLLYAALDELFPQVGLTGLSPLFLWLVAAAGILYTVKWLCFDLLPWSQRLYMVTNTRVIAQSGVLSIRRLECSLLKIEESNYVSRGLVRRLLDIGDVEVETSGRLGTIVFEGVAQPRRVQGAISAQVRALRQEETRRQLAGTPDAIVQQLTAALRDVPASAIAPTEPVRPVSQRALAAQRRLNLLPDEAVVEVIRQHPFVLLVGLLGPVFGLFFVIAATLVVGAALMAPAVAIVVLVLAPWAAWRLSSYLAHQYVLTTERLMEMRSLPLFFDTRNVVQLASVQDITLEIPGVLGRLCNIGDVVVEVAGPAERMVLKSVGAPDDAQKLIFETIDARRRRQREREEQRLVSTLGQWFREYHRLQQSDN